MKKVWCIFEFKYIDGLKEEVFKQTDSQNYESEEQAAASIKNRFGFGWKMYKNDEYLILLKYIMIEEGE